MVGGDTREEVRLIKIFKEPKAWTHQFPRTTLDVLSVGGEEGWWVGGGGSIWQICFSEHNRDVGPWMAVRQSRSTTIFRPLYKRIPVISTGSLHRKHPPSRMSPNPIVTISSSMTGGSSHADVTFNPWYARQVAVIDNNGRWSIWDIEGQEQKRCIWRLNAGPEGQIYDEWVAESWESCQADGWGRICWAGDIHTLTVFNRRQMAIFDIRSVPSKPLSFPNLRLGRSSSWILDVKRSPTEDGHLFIVTSSEVIWMAVQNVTSLDDFSEPTWRARILSSWRHFRAAEDTSLQIEVMAHHAGGPQ
ncbi:MAG: hypothetical protein M1824_000854 [Vezdaea acicularis]|nr:MAG: hypothetical protein M1824_000854 [Vezdaea acicularis]